MQGNSYTIFTLFLYLLTNLLTNNEDHKNTGKPIP